MKNISVIGSPIEHSLSPYLHQEIYKEIGKKIISTKVHVSKAKLRTFVNNHKNCLLYTSPSPRDVEESRMPSSA